MPLTTIAKADRYKLLELTIYFVSWLIIFLLPHFYQMYGLVFGELDSMNWQTVMTHWKVVTPMFLLFCLNNYVLLPKLFLKRRKTLYFLVVISLLAFLWYIQENMQEHHVAAPFDVFHLLNFFLELCVLFENFGVKMYILSLRRDVAMLNMQNEKMLQELKSLKYQINPHFLMNTLNNIQSLIEINPKLAQKTIVKLSRLMRYMLYDNNAHTVSLQTEIDFMKHFIELMQIRYPDTVKVSTEFPTGNEGYKIPPLLFISFLENAFKYGVDYTKESLISVKLRRDDRHLVFYCSNFISDEISQQKKGSGIGLSNVRRRLDLIYGDSYELNISKQDSTYLVEMKIPLIQVSQGSTFL